ncbi:hypothetical protein GQX74_006164 [Glossina fuscipes]|nr:hypothetical protein GQX74_006164 [Glossina fuscipes]
MNSCNPATDSYNARVQLTKIHLLVKDTIYRLLYGMPGKELHHNISAGVILSDQSLVLQSVSRASAGDYNCLAVNSEGKGSSNPVTLRIRLHIKGDECMKHDRRNSSSDFNSRQRIHNCTPKCYPEEDKLNLTKLIFAYLSCKLFH